MHFWPDKWRSANGRSAPASGEAAQSGHQHFHHQFLRPLLCTSQIEVGLSEQFDGPTGSARAEAAVLVERLLRWEAGPDSDSSCRRSLIARIGAIEAQQLGVVAVQDRHHLQWVPLPCSHHAVQQLERSRGITTIDGVGEIPGWNAASVAERIRRRVKDPVLAEKLIPRDHGFGIQRVPLETGYFETYNRDNVELVDSAETPIVEITPDDPIAWYNLAGVYIELDNPQVSDYNTIDMGIQCYMRTLELEPTHLEASFKLMEITLNHKKSDLAIKVLEDAVDHNPDEPLAYYNLISVYDKCKMFEQAEEARKRLKERFAKKAKESSAS